MKKIDMPILIFLIVIFLCAAFLIFGIIKSIPEKIENPKYTVGEYLGIYFRYKGASGVYAFELNGEIIEFYDSYFVDFVIGEKFVIVYDKNKPEIAEVVFEKPVFFNDEKTAVVEGEITNIRYRKIVGDPHVVFKYFVNDSLYERYQFANLNKFPTNVGDKFEVRYLLSNPKRAIIYLDKPIKPNKK